VTFNGDGLAASGGGSHQPDGPSRGGEADEGLITSFSSNA